MTKFIKGDRFRCESVVKDAIFTIVSIRFMKHRNFPSLTAKGIPFFKSYVSYSYLAAIFKDKVRLSKDRIFGRVKEPLMIPV